MVCDEVTPFGDESVTKHVEQNDNDTLCNNNDN